MVFCENAGGSCLNENDNPHEDGTTICKQLYKTQKLLAIDTKGSNLVYSLIYSTSLFFYPPLENLEPLD